MYDGEFENDKRDGWGSHCFPDESLYIGEWADDKIAGLPLQGITSHCKSNINLNFSCIDALSNNQFQMYFLAIVVLGYTFTLEKKEARCHGNSISRFLQNLSVFKDYIIRVRPSTGLLLAQICQAHLLHFYLPHAGNGRLTLKDGSFYEGSWKEGQRKHGKWVSADRKEEYRGDWLEDKRHGTGTVHIQGLLQYTGEISHAQSNRSIAAGASPSPAEMTLT